MKQILIIAPESYPLNGAESIVNIKLLKALSKSREFEIDLISKNSKKKEYKANTIEELGIKVRSLHVIEVDNKININTLWEHFLTLLKFCVVFKGSHWASLALPIALSLCKKHKYDYVLTKSGASPLVAYYLKKHLKIKWVATWNDPYPAFTYPKVYADFFNASKTWSDKRMLSIMKKYVDCHIFPSERLRDHMLPYIGINIDKTLIVPHVVNDDKLNINTYSDKLRIIHSGNLSYPRDSQVFFEGLRKFIDLYPEAQIEITIMGIADNTLKDNIECYNLNSFVKLHGPVSYLESMQVLNKYDIALIIEAQCPIGIFLPTKVSDFMQKKKPIFSISPKIGVLNDLYKDGYIKYFADNTDSDSVADSLKQIYIDYKNRFLFEKNDVNPDYSEEHIIKLYKNLKV